jgi:hypothetical protein
VYQKGDLWGSRWLPSFLQFVYLPFVILWRWGALNLTGVPGIGNELMQIFGEIIWACFRRLIMRESPFRRFARRHDGIYVAKSARQLDMPGFRNGESENGFCALPWKWS